MSSQDSSDQNGDNKYVYILIGVGVSIIAIVAIIYVGRHLYKKSRRIKDVEKFAEPIIEMEEIEAKPLPKKTAADHLEEIKEATQKVLHPLRNSGTMALTYPRERKPTVYSSGISSLRSSFIASIRKNSPPPPPPSPLKYDDIEIKPIRLSLLDALLSKSSKAQTHTIQSGNGSKSSSQLEVDSALSSSRISSETNTTSQSLKGLTPDTNTTSPQSLKGLTPDTNTASPQSPKELNLTSDTNTITPQSGLTPDTNTISLKSPKGLNTDTTPFKSPKELTSYTNTTSLKNPKGLTSDTNATSSKSHASPRPARRLRVFKKETNDYTNFQPVQNIKPVRGNLTSQPEKQTIPTKKKALHSSPTNGAVEESQDDEIILDATVNFVH